MCYLLQVMILISRFQLFSAEPNKILLGTVIDKLITIS
jgi:hypothetical protein